MRIRELRLFYKMTISDVSSHLNVSPQVLFNWETGKAEPNIRNLMALADFFHVTVDYLVGRDNVHEHIIEIKNYIEHMDGEALKQMMYEYLDKLVLK